MSFRRTPRVPMPVSRKRRFVRERFAKTGRWVWPAALFLFQYAGCDLHGPCRVTFLRFAQREQALIDGEPFVITPEAAMEQEIAVLGLIGRFIGDDQEIEIASPTLPGDRSEKNDGTRLQIFYNGR